VRYSPAFSTGLADPQEVDQRSPTSSCAQNSQICTALVFIGIEPAAAQNGGSRSAAATSDRNAARAMVQTVSEPSADSERPTNQMGQEAGPHRSFIIVLVVS
jgi:hypothetical protein